MDSPPKRRGEKKKRRKEEKRKGKKASRIKVERGCHFPEERSGVNGTRRSREDWLTRQKQASFNFFHWPFVTRLLCQMETPRLLLSSVLRCVAWIRVHWISSSSHPTTQTRARAFHPLCVYVSSLGHHLWR